MEACLGPYSFALAGQGHYVTLVDLSSSLLSLARSRLSEDLNVRGPNRILEGDALDLVELFPDEIGTYDAVLLLGPLYHIMSTDLREKAIHQAWAMVKECGWLFCAWVSRWAHYRDVAMREPRRLAAKRAFYGLHAKDGCAEHHHISTARPDYGLLSTWCRDYVRVNSDGSPVHAMHHESPANMPVLLRKLTGREQVTMVGLEGVLAGGLDRLVNELHGEAFEVRWFQIDEATDANR